MKRFPFYKQLNAMDCGPACLRMVARFHGKHYNTDTLRQFAGYSREGVSLLGISEAAEKIGFRTRGVQISFDQLVRDAPTPAILHWDHHHYIVFIDEYGWRKKKVKIADPDKGIVTYSKDEFLRGWITRKGVNGNYVGTALLFEPTPEFFQQAGDKEEKLPWGWVFQYLRRSRWLITQVFIALLVSSLFQLILPFLTQSIVDAGISARNQQFIAVVLVAQLVLLASRSLVDFIRGQLLLRISAHINLSILSDFWMKLFRLPVSYFDTRYAGDTLQRIDDHSVIQSFLTGTALNTVFSVFNFIVFAGVLAYYNTTIFFVFLSGSILYFLWIIFFLRVRRKINYQNFHLNSKGATMTLELIQGMHEIKLNGAERMKRWEWENIQATLFRLGFRSLNYNQIQQAGALLIDQGKDLFISFLAAKMVIDGQLTLGMMLAMQYIIGQLNGPVQQFISLMQTGQDAKISMERLNEVRSLQDEEDRHATYISHLASDRSIHVSGLSFAYPGSPDALVFDRISFDIPQGKVTAIVGVSGSGKTTLLKLLLKFYHQYGGDIRVGESNFRYLSAQFWRSQCGAVLQDGFLFGDTIVSNIALGDENPDPLRLIKACRMANILPFVESLPNGFNTRLGADGVGVSQGQRQRILIARAVYKDPQYLFFDEATNALDANNERAIVENLQTFFEGRTVVVVAHRLSTVKNADKIIVLEKGRIVEEGNHETLVRLKGKYFELVKNQLELGN